MTTETERIAHRVCDRYGVGYTTNLDITGGDLWAQLPRQHVPDEERLRLPVFLACLAISALMAVGIYTVVVWVLSRLRL